MCIRDSDALDQSSPGDSGNRFQVLGYEQVNRLHRLMDTEVPIHGRGNFPTLQIKLRELVQVVKNRLKEEEITVRDIRLNGGAASFILGNETSEVSVHCRIFTHRPTVKCGCRCQTCKIRRNIAEIILWICAGLDLPLGYRTEVGALFTTVSSIRVSRVSVMVSVRDRVK